MNMLTELDYLPAGLLDCQANELVAVLNGPTLIHLQGRQQAPLFVSVLIHGNETAGWDAIKQLLPRYDVAGGQLPLPRSLSLFIGNVSAASQGVRRLPDQPDYNRVWPGCTADAGVADEYPEQAMMRSVVDRMAGLGVFASIDVHNNTGLNPHYACINVIHDDFLHLATLFGRTVVFFTDPCQVASKAMSSLCPSVTLECGKVGQQNGIDHAADYIDACLHLVEFPGHPVAIQDVDLFHTVATVKIPESVSFGFDEPDVHLQFSRDIEYMNFRELSAGAFFGSVINGGELPLQITNEHGVTVKDRYFSLQDNDIVLRKAVMPSMLTTDKTVIRQDCLCYLMERYDLQRVQQD